ncbi:MAG: M48 family metallopeptidase [Rikenellaceae bacterium]|nr:M48 family metallopeptidase [Rikenellaceae bacterium]
MEYVGIHTQQRRNNTRSTILLILFPCLVLLLVFLFCFILAVFANDGQSEGIGQFVMEMFTGAAPIAMGVVVIWFLIAYFTNTRIISRATHSRPLERKENKRIYNMVENLCMSQGMPMPKINVIDDPSLNAFASGINDKSYTVTLTTGIMNTLNDQELEGVIAHELSHIRNRDVRLMIVSIVFVGIFAMVAQMSLRMAVHSPRSRNNKGGGAAIVLLLAALLAGLGYFFSTMMRFAISRKREYMADAGAAEMTRNPQALANALRKICGNPAVANLGRDDVAQLFIEHPKMGANGKKSGSLFATHPPIESRIRILEQF